jgi:hypothetical protein
VTIPAQDFIHLPGNFRGSRSCIRHIRKTTDDTPAAARETHPMNTAQAELDEIQEMFDRIDENGDRCINFEEYAGLMLAMDHTRSESGLRAAFDAIDTDRDGRASFDEFRAWISG